MTPLDDAIKVRLAKAERRAIDKLAEERGVKSSQYVRQLVREAIARERPATTPRKRNA